MSPHLPHLSHLRRVWEVREVRAVFLFRNIYARGRFTTRLYFFTRGREIFLRGRERFFSFLLLFLLLLFNLPAKTENNYRKER